jgi:lambda family phage portal protein
MTTWPRMVDQGTTVASVVTALRRGYDGAGRGRRMDGWITRTSSSDAETRRQLNILRNRSRDLVRNSARARRIVDIHASNAVGDGIMANISTGDAALDERAEKLWKAWCEVADAGGQLDFYGMQRLIMKGVVEAGEVLARFRPRRPSDGLPVPLQVQLLEAEHLDSDKESTDPRIVQGVEFSQIGARAAYWIYQDHPGDPFTMRTVARRIDASEICHVYRIDRPGQSRGVPWLAPVIKDIRELDEYEDAVIFKAKIAACFAAFVTSPEGAESAPLAPGSVNDDGYDVETFEPGMIARLRPGEDVKFAEPGDAGPFADYAIFKGLTIAAGAGVTYDQLTGDLRQANYSSLRAGKIEFRRSNADHQYKMLVPMFCAPVMKRFLATAIDAGLLPEADYRVEWIAPADPAIDSMKEVEADKMAVRSGFLPWSYVVRRNGYDPDEVLEEIVKWNKKLDDAKVVLDVDPRQEMKMQAATPQPAPVNE